VSFGIPNMLFPDPPTYRSRDMAHVHCRKTA